jgi:hypothetical protein
MAVTYILSEVASDQGSNLDLGQKLCYEFLNFWSSYCYGILAKFAQETKVLSPYMADLQVFLARSKTGQKVGGDNNILTDAKSLPRDNS